MMIRRQFPDLHMESMLPALDELIFARHDRFPEQYSRIFRVMSSKRSIEQTSEISGLGNFAVVGEAQDVTFDAAVPGFNKTYEHLQYGLGFKISRVMVDDDRWAMVDKQSAALGRSGKETKEITGALVLNRGFSALYPGPDGKALFAVDHPLVKSGGVQSNLLTPADLDVDSLQIGLTAFRKQRDINGHRARVRPSMLIVGADNEFGAIETLGGDHLRPDTANHTPNAVKKRSGLPAFDELFVYDYLEDGDAWFIKSPKEDTELRWYDRERFNVVHDVDFKSRSIMSAAWMRFSCGWSSYYGIFGNAGAD